MADRGIIKLKYRVRGIDKDYVDVFLTLANAVSEMLALTYEGIGYHAFEFVVPCLVCGDTLEVQYVRPSIPTRSNDYQASCSSCYDGAPDTPRKYQCIGTGINDHVALADLLDQQEEQL